MAKESTRGLITIEDQLLTCVICTQHYNKPKALPCHHTFCEACLSLLVQLGTIECPVCRRKCDVPDYVSNLPTDFRVEQLKDVLLTIQRNHGEDSCDVCKYTGKWRKSTEYCVHCQKNLCPTCTTTHASSASFKSHSLVKKNSTECVRCSKHREEFLSNYCASCDLLVCMVCLMTSCIGHKTQEISTAKALYKTKLNDNFIEAEKDISASGSISAKLKNMLKPNGNNLSKIKSQIKENTQRVIDEVKRQENQLLNQVDSVMDTHKGIVRKELEQRESLYVVSDTLIKSFKEYSESADPMLFILAQRSLVNMLGTQVKDMNNLRTDLKEPHLVFLPRDVKLGVLLLDNVEIE